MKSIYWVIIILIVIIILGGAYWYIQSSKTDEAEVKITPIENTQEKQDNATKSAASSDSQSIMVDVDTVTLKSVDNYTGSGMATRIFANGVFTHSVTASIGDPIAGKFYEGWIVNMSLSPPFFSTGKLEKEGNSYKLNFTSNTNYSNYNNVVITEETKTKGLDGVPEAHVLEGEFSN